MAWKCFLAQEKKRSPICFAEISPITQWFGLLVLVLDYLSPNWNPAPVDVCFCPLQLIPLPPPRVILTHKHTHLTLEKFMLTLWETQM